MRYVAEPAEAGRGAPRRGRFVIAVAFAITGTLAWWGPVGAEGVGAATAPADPWPREVKLASATALIYQPQVNSWAGNTLAFRAAVAVKPAGATQDIFGVIWGTARTQVDRASRIVRFDAFTLTRSNFPTLPDQGASYMAALQTHFAAAQRTIALDRLEASLAAAAAVKPQPVAVNNDPPHIIISDSPAILLPIDGSPVLRPVPGTRFERVINTRALILREQGASTYYLHVYDGWLFSGTTAGPWYQPMVFPPGIDRLARDLARSGQVDLLDGGHATTKPSLAQGVPAIYVSETPAELIVFRGPPRFTPVAGTSLQWAADTTADVFLDTGNNAYYILVAGRWFRAPALAGPWSFVPSTDLPADFRRIPFDSPAGVVLAAVAGTPQAQEAVIANSIPQTATVPRVNGPTFSPVLDGTPQLRPIAGTTLQYVVNSPTPIIQVSASSYYAVRAGVWFSAMSLSGPWVVAARVPEVIYTIPVTSPLHYVTYVHVYGSTAKVVYVGYTPGYLGTVVAPAGVVVYGTGYPYQPWVGAVWYPPPATYGVMAQPVYNPAVGMAFGFAMGVTTAALTGAYYHPAYYPHYWGYPCCGSTSANVYGHYGNAAWSGSRTWYSNSSGTVGTNFSGSYTNYRTGTTGSYQGSRSYNPYTGAAQGGYNRTFDTPSGTSGSVSRAASYDPSTGRYSYGSNVTATGPEGRTVTSNVQAGAGPGQAGAERTTTATNPATGASRTTQTARGAGPQGYGAARQTTYTNPTSGKTETYGAAREGNNLYADHDGNVYRSTGSGWQKQTSGGWESAAGNTSWAQHEQQARSSAENRFNSFSQSWPSHSGSGEWSDRFASQGGWDARGGGGWGGRFGGGGWGGGRFGGFRR